MSEVGLIELLSVARQKDGADLLLDVHRGGMLIISRVILPRRSRSS
jgi:hypothetical protein